MSDVSTVLVDDRPRARQVPLSRHTFRTSLGIRWQISGLLPDRLLKSWRDTESQRLIGSTHINGTHVPVEETSTASETDIKDTMTDQYAR